MDSTDTTVVAAERRKYRDIQQDEAQESEEVDNEGASSSNKNELTINVGDNDDNNEEDVFLDEITTGLRGKPRKQSFVSAFRSLTCCQKTVLWLLLIYVILISLGVVIQPFLPLVLLQMEEYSNLCECWKPVRDLKRGPSTGYFPVVEANSTLGGLQGLAHSQEKHPVDSGEGDIFYLYEAQTRGMRIYQIQGVENDDDNEIYLDLRRTVSYSMDKDFPFIAGEFPLVHIGGIAHTASGGNKHNNNTILLATHGELDSITIRGPGALVRVDPNTLDVFETMPMLLERSDDAYDWVAVDPSNGIGYAAEFFNITTIQRFNSSTFQKLDPMNLILPNKDTFPSTANGIQFIQSGTFGPDGHLLLLGDDYQTTLYKIDTVTGRLVSSQALLIGNEVDGLEYIPALDALLVGIHRKGHSGLKSESIYILRRDESDSCDCTVWENEDEIDGD